MERYVRRSPLRLLDTSKMPTRAQIASGAKQLIRNGHNHSIVLLKLIVGLLSPVIFLLHTRLC